MYIFLWFFHVYGETKRFEKKMKRTIFKENKKFYLVTLKSFFLVDNKASYEFFHIFGNEILRHFRYFQSIKYENYKK